MAEVTRHDPALFLSSLSAEAAVLQYGKVVAVAPEPGADLKVVQE